MSKNTKILYNQINGSFHGKDPQGPDENCGGRSNTGHGSSGLAVQKSNNITVEGNVIRGGPYWTDALSVYSSSKVSAIRNDVDVDIVWCNSAPMTMGDDSEKLGPGRDNYVGYNKFNGR
jgi:hypothetical protein